MGSTKALAGADWGSIAWVTFSAAAGIIALACGFQGWLLKRANSLERAMLIVAGFALVYTHLVSDVIGFASIVAVVAMQLLRRAPVPA